MIHASFFSPAFELYQNMTFLHNINLYYWSIPFLFWTQLMSQTKILLMKLLLIQIYLNDRISLIHNLIIWLMNIPGSWMQPLPNLYLPDSKCFLYNLNTIFHCQRSKIIHRSEYLICLLIIINFQQFYLGRS